MIYVTGDTHGNFQRLSNKNFPKNKSLTKSDYVIILGDFGGVWDGSKADRYWLDWLNERNFTTLFIDGNHENFDLLESYPVVNFRGGKAQRIRESVFHLMRGEIYTIENKKFLVMGGALSIDKDDRVEGKTWWKQEIPNEKDFKNARVNMMKHGWKVDYILTHCADYKTENQIIGYNRHWFNGFYNFLDSLDHTVNYKKWLFGHYHKNVLIGDKRIGLYNKIIEIGEIDE